MVNKLHSRLYKIKKCIANKNYYYYIFKRIISPRLIDTKYKKNVCSMFNFSPSIIRWIEDDAYQKLFDHPLNSNSLVMDVGGFTGNWTNGIYLRYNCNIIVYEPVREYYSILKNRFINKNKIIAKNYGLGNVNKEILIEKRNVQSTTFISNKNLAEEVNIKSIKNELSNYKKIDLMSINIEGGEYELMDAILEHNLTSKINNIQIQFHEWYPSYEKSHILSKEIRKRLSLSHKLTYSYPFVWENWQLKC